MPPLKLPSDTTARREDQLKFAATSGGSSAAPVSGDDRIFLGVSLGRGRELFVRVIAVPFDRSSQADVVGHDFAVIQFGADARAVGDPVLRPVQRIEPIG